MSKFLVFILFLNSLPLLVLRDKLIYENCGRENDTIEIENVSITPMPIIIPGELRFTANINVKRDLSQKTNIHVKLFKQLRLPFSFEVKVPCINNAGSCSYDSCSLKTLTNNAICEFFPKNIKCICPFQAGNFSAENYLVEIPSVSGISSWLAKGNYKVEVIIRDEIASEQLSCLRAFLSLDSG